jgi:ketosteroid isomerase-like protein
MESANLDFVRSIYTAWESGDFSSTDWADREMQFVIADGPAPGTWTGPEVAEGLRGLLSAYNGMGAVADEYREIGADCVVVLAHPIGRGKVSGLNVEQMGTKGAQLFRVHDGKVTRLVHYFDRDRALADLGLKE